MKILPGTHASEHAGMSVVAVVWRSPLHTSIHLGAVLAFYNPFRMFEQKKKDTNVEVCL